MIIEILENCNKEIGYKGDTNSPSKLLTVVLYEDFKNMEWEDMKFKTYRENLSNQTNICCWHCSDGQIISYNYNMI